VPGVSLVQRSHTDCGECDASIMRRPWLTMGSCAKGKNSPKEQFYLMLLLQIFLEILFIMDGLIKG